MTYGAIVWCPHCAEPHRLGQLVCPMTGRELETAIHRVDTPPHPLTGVVLNGKYRVGRIIGRDGHSTVLEGENVVLRRQVALKVVTDRSKLDAIERLRREARIIASLQHPSICDIHDVGHHPLHGPFLVTERLHGVTVAQRFRWKRSFDLAEAAQIIAQVLSGLHAAHAEHIVHRDMTPKNIFLVERVGCTPVAKVLDFGSAADLSTKTVDSAQPAPSVGTPQYMAPEQLLGNEASAQTDLFAVGVTLYEMATGQHPFAGRTLAETQARIVRGAPAAPSLLRRAISKPLESVILRALSKNPAHRFEDAYAMQIELLRSALPATHAGSRDAEPVSETSPW